MRRPVLIVALTTILAYGSAHAQVVSGSSFSMAVAGFNSSNSGSYLVAPVVSVFGTTATYPGAGLGGQTVTVTSSETTNGSNIVDTFTISVPTNFDPTGTTVGSPAGPAVGMEADIGGYNAGAPPIQLTFPQPSLATSGVTGSLTYSGGTLSLSPQANVQLTNNNMNVDTAEGVSAGGADLAQFAINSFSFTLTYPAAVPEPGSLALCGFGLAAIPALWRRRRAEHASAR